MAIDPMRRLEEEWEKLKTEQQRRREAQLLSMAPKPQAPEIPTEMPAFKLPSGWEFTPDYETFVSPEGEQFNLAEMQTRLVDIGFTNLIYDYTRDMFIPGTPEQVTERERLYEQLAAEGYPVPKRLEEYPIEEYITDYNQRIAEERARVEAIFQAVFPGMTIEDVWQTSQEITVTLDMPEAQRVEAERKQDEFLQSIRDMGRTPETELLLETMFSQITPEIMDDIFGVPEAPEYVPMEAAERTKILQEKLGFTPAPAPKTPEERQQRVDIFRDYRSRGGKLAYNQWELMGMPQDITVQLPPMEQRKAIYEQEVAEAPYRLADPFLLAKMNGDIDLWKQLGGAVVMGIGKSLVNLGITFNRYGWMPELAKDALDLGEHLETALIPMQNPIPSEEMEWRWPIWRSDYLNPEYLVTNIVPSLTQMAPLIVGSILVATGVGAVVGAPLAATAIPIWATKLLTMVAAGLGGSIFATPFEASMEAGDAFRQAKEMGKPDEQAWEIYDGVFDDNLKVIGGMNALEIGLAVTPFPKGGNVLLRRLAAIGMVVGVQPVLEAGEEELQYRATQKWLELPVEAGELAQARWLGWIMGLGLSGTGSVFQTFTSHMKQGMTPDIAAIYNQGKAEALASGLNEQQSEVAGLNRVAETPQGKEFIEERLADLKAKATEDATPTGNALFIPEQDLIIQSIMQDTNAKRIAQVLADKIPGFEKLVKAIDPRELISRDAATIKDIISRQVYGLMEVNSRGKNQANLFMNELNAVSTNPVKLFGFRAVEQEGNIIVTAENTKIRPEYAKEVTAGTLEDIFTRPYKYELTPKQAKYVELVHQQNKRLLELLQNEGVAPQGVLDDWWIHRVVLGRFTSEGELIPVRGRPGMKGQLAQKRAYEYRRKAQTMHDGMKWNILYSDNPAQSIQTYTEEVYSKIAVNRFMKGIDAELIAIGEAGLSPTDFLASQQWEGMSTAKREQLLERRKLPKELAKKGWRELTQEQRNTLKTGLPIFARAAMTSQELDYAKKLQAVINRVIRGEPPPKQTIKALEKRFPELGKRLRTLTEEPVNGKKALNGFVATTKTQMEALAKTLAKKEAVLAKTAKELADMKGELAKVRNEAARIRQEELEKLRRVAYEGVPDETKLTEAFKLMDYDNRLVYRESMESRIAEAETVIYEQARELDGINEFLKTDPVATYMGHIGKQKISLIGFLSKHNGRFPESVTVNEARMLLMGAEPKGVEAGRVKRAYVLDELAAHVNMEEQQLIDHMEFMWTQKQTADDLRSLIKMAQARVKTLKTTLEILNSIDTSPENIPQVEFIPPEAVTPPVIAITPEVTKRYTLEAVPETEVPIGADITAKEYLINDIETGRSIGSFEIADVKVEDALTIVNIKVPFEKMGRAKFAEALSRVETEAIERGKNNLDIIGYPKHSKIYQAAGYEDIGVSATYKGLFDEEYTIFRKKLVALPKAEAGMPKAGLQSDIFGYAKPFTPKGKGEVTQISMDDYAKLAKAREDAGFPPQPDVYIKPKVEGIPEMEAETSFQQVVYETPPAQMTDKERMAELKSLRSEIKALVEGKRAEMWKAKNERAVAMDKIKGSPPIGYGYIPLSGFSGKIYSQAVVDQVNEFFGHKAGNPVLNAAVDIEGIMVTAGAALDVSFPFIQGLPFLGMATSYLMNPKTFKLGTRLMGSWFKAASVPILGYIHPEWAYQYMNKYKATAERRVAFGGTEQSFEYFEALNKRQGIGSFLARVMHKLPGDPYSRAELVFYSAGEILRNEAFMALEGQAQRTGEMFNLAQSLDKMSGQMSTQKMGVPRTVRQIEKLFAWFAPRYTRACMTLTSDIFRGGMSGAMARRSLSGMLVAGSTFLVALQVILRAIEGRDDDEVLDEISEIFGIKHDPITGGWEWRPGRHFMAIRIGDTYVGVGGFWYGLLGIARSTQRAIDKYGDEEPLDIIKLMLANLRDIPLLGWWWSRASVTSHIIGDLWSKRDFLGYGIETPEQYARYLAELLSPFWAREVAEQYIPWGARRPTEDIAKASIREVIARFGGALLGMRVLEQTAYMEFSEEASKYIRQMPEDEVLDRQKEAWEQGKLKWENLDYEQQWTLLQRYPELKALYEQYESERSMRSTPIYREMFGYDRPDGTHVDGAFEIPRKDYYRRLNNLFDQLAKGEISTTELREKLKDAQLLYAGMMEQLRTQYQSTLDDIEAGKAKRTDKYEWEFDLAMIEYESLIYDSSNWQDTFFDEPDWDKRDKLINEFIEKWGIDFYERIRTVIADRMRDNGAPEWLIRKGEDSEKLTRDYWELPYKPFAKMDETDEANGEIPAEYYALWKEYQALKTDEQREAFLEQNPELAKDWRGEWRKNHPEDDARLALWGYGGKLQSMEAYELVEKWGAELGIPLEQMGLGLPPRVLMPNYFEHANVVRQTSGGSVQAKLYKLEHPEFLEWGVENWGWSDLSDENIDILRLRVNFETQFKEYDAYGDRKQIDVYIADDAMRAAEREKMLFTELPTTGPGTLSDFGEAYYRKQAYGTGYSETNWDAFVEYSALPIWGFWQERFLLDPANEGFYNEYLDEKIGKHFRVEVDANGKPVIIPPQIRDEIYGTFYDQFVEWEKGGLSDIRKAELHKLTINGMTFKEAWYTKEAYDIAFPDNTRDDYVEYFVNDEFAKPKGRDTPRGLWFEDDWWLLEHKEFYGAMYAMDIWKLDEKGEGRISEYTPTKEVWELFLIYDNLATEAERVKFRENHRDLQDWGAEIFGWKPPGGRVRGEIPTWREQRAKEIALAKKMIAEMRKKIRR